ncbi:hypothetical protein D3C84_1291100 [compost metagenome]
MPAENLTVDYIPGAYTDMPISRRGMFSGIVAKAFLEEKISADTVRMCLKSQEISSASMVKIAELWAV